MEYDVDLIFGVNLGVEFVPAIPEEDIPNTLIIDLFIVRILIQMVN
jgi:hypothetical protein